MDRADEIIFDDGNGVYGVYTRADFIRHEEKQRRQEWVNSGRTLEEFAKKDRNNVPF